MDRIRDAGKEMRSQSSEQLSGWQHALEDAAEDARRDLGRVAVRAQRTPEALTALSREIRDRRAALKA